MVGADDELGSGVLTRDDNFISNGVWQVGLIPSSTNSQKPLHVNDRVEG